MRLLDFVSECADAIAESQRMQEARQQAQATNNKMKQSMFKNHRQRAQASRAMRSFFSRR